MKVADFLILNKRNNPYSSNAALKVEISQHFVHATAVCGESDFMVDLLVSHIIKTGWNASQSGEIMR
jgi:hypothetical protein